MTFIDLKNRCVFNRSNLGKQYAANVLMERCGIKPEKQWKENLKPMKRVVQFNAATNLMSS